MSRPDTDPGTWISEMYEEERRASSAPDLEEILAFLDGELDEEAADAFRDRLSIHPEAARLAAELAEPSEPDPDADLPLPDFDTVRDALVAEGILGLNDSKDDSGAEVVPIAGRERARSTSGELWRWAAVVLLAVNLGLVFLLLRPGGDESGPSTGTATWTLESDQRLRSNARAPSTVIADSAADHVLVLTLGDRKGFEDFRLVLEDDAGNEIWRDEAAPRRNGTFTWQASADYLAPGAYELRLEGIDGDNIEKLAVYPFTWERSEPGEP